MTVVIRTAVEADVPGIVEIDLAAGRLDGAGKGNFSSSISAAIADPARLVLVAGMAQCTPREGTPAVVGWAKTHQWDSDEGAAPAGHYLAGITVLPDFRRRGVAGKLTEARLAWIWQRADRAWYVVNARNQASLALHRTLGFLEVARGPRFHSVTFDGGEGVLLGAARPLA